MTEDIRTLSFPFSVSLEDFEIEYYPGTYAPTDYVSLLKIQDGTEETEFTVAMNRIARYRGYRFYQSGYVTRTASDPLWLSAMTLSAYR